MAIIIQMAAGPVVILMGSGGGQSAVVGGLFFPYILKLSFSISIVRNTCCHLLHASRLFFFQLAHIAFDSDSDSDADADATHHLEPLLLRRRRRPPSATRFQRALRLVYERLAQARRTTATSAALPGAHDHSLHALSMIAL